MYQSEGKIFKVLWSLGKRGYSELTLEGYSKKLRLLGKSVNLDSPESVTRYLTNSQLWKNSFKETIVSAYLHYVKFYGLKWKKPKYQRPERLPYVPLSEQVNKLIAHSSRKYAMIYNILRDTSLRPIELHGLSLRKIDLEVGIIYPETAKTVRVPEKMSEQYTVLVGRETAENLEKQTYSDAIQYLLGHHVVFPSKMVSHIEESIKITN